MAKQRRKHEALTFQEAKRWARGAVDDLFGGDGAALLANGGAPPPSRSKQYRRAEVDNWRRKRAAA
jgi:hypothetical protein